MFYLGITKTISLNKCTQTNQMASIKKKKKEVIIFFWFKMVD